MTAKTLTLAEALAEVSAGLSRIPKSGTAPSSMGGFKFVRETDVIEALKPLLDERGILLQPDVELLRFDTFERLRDGKPAGYNALCTVSLSLYAVKGEEKHLLARTIGQGADTQDKAPGKATTAAKKQALLIAFAIPTGDDPEWHDDTPSRGTRRTEQPSQAARGRQAGSAVPNQADSKPAVVELTPEQVEARYAFGERHGFTREQFEEEVVHVCKGQALWELVPEDWRIFADLVKVGEVKPPDAVSAERQKRLERAKELAEQTRKEPRQTAPDPEPLTLGVDE